jgi:hypothetical protein
MKIFGWGGPGAGKSYFGAHMPSPILTGICGGDHGIEGYLSPENRELVFDLDNPNDFEQFVDFGIASEDKLKSLVLDPMTLGWENWMDFFNEQFDGEIKSHQWKDVKAPWKKLHYLLMASKLHVYQTAWVQTTEWEQTESAPNVKGPLNIKKVEKPKIEIRVPHIFDIALYWKIKENNRGLPTPIHEAMITKVRRPKTMNPKEIYVGKTWSFDEREPEDPWQKIVEPFLEHWQAGAVDHVGGLRLVNGKPTTDRHASDDEKDVIETALDATMGELLVAITEFKGSMTEYKRFWDANISGPINDLDDTRQKVVREAHEKKKEDLT